MRPHLRSVLTCVAFALSATGLLRADDAMKDYYENNKPPRAQLIAEEPRDASVFKELQIPSILAILKYELSQGGQWPKLSASQRQSLISIMDDPNLKYIYTGKQSTMATAAGGQTIDANTVKFNQDGWYSSGQGAQARDPYSLAKIILHETGHVYQERNNWLPRPMGTKEWFPEELEAQLSSRHLTPEEVANVTKILQGETAGGKCQDISGSWQGDLVVDSVSGESNINIGQKRTLRGDQFSVTQSECEITLKFFNNEISGTMNGDTATLTSKISGAVTEAKLTHVSGHLSVSITQKSGSVDVVSLGSLNK